MATSRRLATNLFTGVLNNVFRICIQIIMLPLMARWLGPAELGLFGLAQPMLRFVGLLTDAGIGDSLAQDKSKDTLAWSSAFWGLLVIGTIMSVTVYAASFFVGQAAGQPRLPIIMLPLSFTLFLTCTTVIPYTLLLRDGNLAPGTIADFIATLTGAIVGLILAYNHFGVWAIVTQFLTTAVVRSIAINCVRPFLPKMEFSLRSLLSHTRIGGAILGGRLIDLGGGQTENTQVSRSLGHTANGYYGYANQIGRFFSDAISNPMWANLYYVAINKEPDEVLRHYVRSHRLFGLIIFPAVIFMALSLPTLVPILLGPKWGGSTYPIMMMVLSSPFPALASYCGAVLFARRNVKIMWCLTGAYALGRVAVAFLAWRYQVFGLTVGLSVINIVFYLYVVLFVSPVIGNRRSDLLKAIAAPLAAAVVAGGAYYYAQSLSPNLLWLFASAALTLPIYPAALFLLDRQAVLTDFSQMMKLLKRQEDEG
jgi:O-antigen/teichoic acid export membrane protein